LNHTGFGDYIRDYLLRYAHSQDRGDIDDASGNVIRCHEFCYRNRYQPGTTQIGVYDRVPILQCLLQGGCLSGYTSIVDQYINTTKIDM